MLSIAIVIDVPLFTGYWNPFDMEADPDMGFWLAWLLGFLSICAVVAFCLIVFYVYKVLQKIF